MKYRLIIDKEAEESVTVTVRAPSDLARKIEELVRGERLAEGLLGHKADEMRRLSFDEIECITVLDRRVVAIDTEGERYQLKERLRELEEILPSHFIRINKSALANERRILRFKAAFSGGVDAVFCSGYREYVSRRCFAEIKRRYEGV